MISKREKWMVALFLFTLPLTNPWVRGDGVGYYAYARSLLIQRNLNFEPDWIAANPSFRMGRVDSDGRLRPVEYTTTGHLDNHFTVGPAILWAPFLIFAHVAVLTAGRLGASLPADGFSWPYRVAMALATATYGFFGLLLSYRLACKYFEERWALLATIGIWFASSLPVYMYFNPSYAHADSAFAVALFLYWWDRTRGSRTIAQWAGLGAAAALMMNVYYVNGALLSIPLIESLGCYWRLFSSAISTRVSDLWTMAKGNLAFVAVAFAGFLPTLITKKIVYGGFFNFGYTETWYWKAPFLLRVCFSPDHGLFTWTPLLLVAVAGLFVLIRRERTTALYLIAGFVAFLYVMACYQLWDGISSFGSRFFVSLTPIFIVGLAAMLRQCAEAWKSRLAPAVATFAVCGFIVWNLGFMFQWGMHMVPVRGPVSFREMAYAQVTRVPATLSNSFADYFTSRRSLMSHIEETDVEQLERRLATTAGSSLASPEKP